MSATTSPAGAVVTGAGRGLGKEIARLLAQRGHQVLVTDVDEGAARAAAEEIAGETFAMAVDVRDRAEVDAACAAVLERSGRLDVWVNNAGVLITGPAWEQAEATRGLMMEVNAIGTMNGTLAALAAMRPHGGGHVVNIVSLAGLSAVPGEAVYAASKRAAIGFSLSTVADLRHAGVTDIDISCICPDGIWTPMLHDRLDDPSAALSFSGSLLETEDVVAAVRKVLDRPRLVTALPGWRGALARAGDAVPEVGLRLLPFVVRRGRRAQRRLRERQESR